MAWVTALLKFWGFYTFLLFTGSPFQPYLVLPAYYWSQPSDMQLYSVNVKNSLTCWLLYPVLKLEIFKPLPQQMKHWFWCALLHCQISMPTTHETWWNFWFLGMQLIGHVQWPIIMSPLNYECIDVSGHCWLLSWRRVFKILSSGLKHVTCLEPSGSNWKMQL